MRVRDLWIAHTEEHVVQEVIDEPAPPRRTEGHISTTRVKCSCGDERGRAWHQKEILYHPAASDLVQGWVDRSQEDHQFITFLDRSVGLI